MPRLVAVLALLLCASGAAAQDPLEVAGNLGDTVNAALGERTRELWAQRDLALRQLDSAAAVEARQRQVRERVLAALGGFPARTPLNARVTRECPPIEQHHARPAPVKPVVHIALSLRI